MSPHQDITNHQIIKLGSISNNISASEPTKISNSGSGTSLEMPKVQNGRISHVNSNCRSKYLAAFDLDVDYDLICVGFGPASLSVAIALHDSIASSKLHFDSPPKVLFIEKQSRFTWHAGMLLPGAKMQIPFMIDLATLRDPQSHFTFLSYLHHQGRLFDFTNLRAFFPARVEFEDYLRWCSSHFDHLVQYGREVVSISPAVRKNNAVTMFTVKAQSSVTGDGYTVRGRNVLLATGGQPSLPQTLPAQNPRILHSSQYLYMIDKILADRNSAYKVIVVGAGQSAAEIFQSVQKLYPNSSTRLVMHPEFLKPCDDTPFVNAIFSPEYIDSFFVQSAKDRREILVEFRPTNYGVVRLELIDELFETMYAQKRDLGPDERSWPHRIMGNSEISNVKSYGEYFDVTIRSLTNGIASSSEEIVRADLIIAATGYERNSHVSILQDTWEMLPKTAPETIEFSDQRDLNGWNVNTDQGERKLAVGCDYQVNYEPGRVAPDAGIWLQGCCEGTHGLSDTLLSVLATRSGEIVQSIFGAKK